MKMFILSEYGHPLHLKLRPFDSGLWVVRDDLHPELGENAQLDKISIRYSQSEIFIYHGVQHPDETRYRNHAYALYK